MDYKEEILKYIKIYKKGEPIFIDDIKEHILKIDINEKNHEKLKKYINVIMNRIVNEKTLKSDLKGIYYKPIKNVFGEMPIDRIKIIERKYLKEKDGKIKGYISGEKLFNRIGLTTQVSNNFFIITNDCGKKNKYYDENLKVTVKKSSIDINNENYLYLQLIDIFINKEKINIESQKRNDILHKYIKDNKLDFEKIIKYAKETNNKKVLEDLYEIAR